MTKEKTHGNKKEIDYKVFDAIVQFKVTKGFCADYLGISEDTIENRLREDHDMTFTEYRELKNARVGLKLQQKAVEQALKGNNTMLIFALKNMAKWSDNVDASITSKIQINIDKDDEAL